MKLEMPHQIGAEIEERTPLAIEQRTPLAKAECFWRVTDWGLSRSTMRWLTAV